MQTISDVTFGILFETAKPFTYTNTPNGIKYSYNL
jgi:hypothetical protein